MKEYAKEYAWHGCTVRVTKKNIKNANLRIKPDEPQVIHISIPRSMTYQAAQKLLEQPRILRWIENYQKKVQSPPVLPRMQNEERLKYAADYRKHLQEVLPGLFRKWEQELGVRCGKVTIRDTRSQ